MRGERGERDGQRRARVRRERSTCREKRLFRDKARGVATVKRHRRSRSRLASGGDPRGDARGGASLTPRLERCPETLARETRACRAERAYLSHPPHVRVSRAERSHRGAQRENRQHPRGLHHRTGGERPRERAEHAAPGRASPGVRRLEDIARGGNAEPRVVEAVEGRRRSRAVPSVSLLRAPRQDGRGRLRSRVHGLATRPRTGRGDVPTAVSEPKPPDDHPRPPDFPETCAGGVHARWTAQRVAEWTPGAWETTRYSFDGVTPHAVRVSSNRDFAKTRDLTHVEFSRFVLSD